MTSSNQTENAEILDQLITYLEDQDSGFVIVEVNEQTLQQKAVNRIQSRFPESQCQTIDLSSVSFDTSPLSNIRHSVANMPDVKIFLILNFQALAGDKREDRIKIVRELNFSREAYYRLNKLFIFFFPTFFVDLIIRHAKDFFDFIPVTFSLKSQSIPSRNSVIEHRRPFLGKKFLENQVAYLRDALSSGDLTQKSIGEKLEALGDCYEQLFKYRDTLESYENSLPHYSDEKNKADIYAKIGRIQSIQGHIDKAEKNLEKAFEIYGKTENNHSQAVTLGYIARIRVDKGQIDEALALFEEMLAVFEERGDRHSRAVTLGYIARIREDKGQVDEALKLYEEILVVFEERGNRREQALTMGDIARIRESKGQVDEALKLHKERLAVFEELGDQRSRAVTLGDIARIRVSKGEVDEALKLDEERLAVFEEMGDLSQKAHTLWSIGLSEFQKNNIQGAIKHLSDSYNLHHELGRTEGIGIVGKDLGNLLCLNDQVADGIPILRRSREAFAQLGKNKEASQLSELIQAFEKAP